VRKLCFLKILVVLCSLFRETLTECDFDFLYQSWPKNWYQTSLRCVHTTLEEFESAALILRLGLPSTLIRHENGAFRKRSSNRRNLKTLAFHFRVDRKHFENGAFWKRRPQDNHVVFFKTNPIWLVIIVTVFKFLRCSVDGKHLMRQSEWNLRFQLPYVRVVCPG